MDLPERPLPIQASLALGFTVSIESGGRSVLGLNAGGLHVPLGFGFALLGFRLTVSLRIKRLNCLSQAHTLVAGSCRARSALRRCSRHVRPEAIEADAQILADVGRSHTLAQVLESRAGLRRRHAGELLDLAPDGLVLGKDVIHSRLMR